MKYNLCNSSPYSYDAMREDWKMELFMIEYKIQ